MDGNKKDNEKYNPIEIIVVTKEDSQDNTEIAITPAALSAEIAAKMQPIDFKTIMGQSQILGLGEIHSDVRPALHIVENADVLKALGITHYCIEAKITIQPLLNKLNAGETVDLSQVKLAPDHQEEHRAAVLAMASRGIKIVALNVPESTMWPSQAVREKFIFERLLQQLELPSSRILILFGAGHLIKHVNPEDVPTYLGQLLDAAGKSISTARYVRVWEKLNFYQDPTVNTALKNDALINTSFMVNANQFKPWKHDQLYDYEADYWIHLSEEKKN